jgi:hypothetical protein
LTRWPEEYNGGHHLVFARYAHKKQIGGAKNFFTQFSISRIKGAREER